MFHHFLRRFDSFQTYTTYITVYLVLLLAPPWRTHTAGNKATTTLCRIGSTPKMISNLDFFLNLCIFVGPV